MNRIRLAARNFGQDESGAALIEYALLVLLMAVLCMVAIRTIGSKVSNGFNQADSNIP